MSGPGATRTTTQLLDALRDPGNDVAWEQIDARFRPVIAGLARRFGLDGPAAEEVAQQTLSEMVRVYREGRYDRAAGRLSSWILGIAHNTTRRALRDRKGAPAQTEALPEAADDLRDVWSEERDRAILAEALGILRDDSSIDDRTLEAFELVGLRGVPAAEVAATCGMTVDQVYVAKSRVTKRLQVIVAELTEAFEDDG